MNIENMSILFANIDLINKAILKTQQHVAIHLLDALKEEDSKAIEELLDKIAVDYNSLRLICEIIKGKIDDKGYYINQETGERENENNW